MATANDVLTVAKGEIGTKESPAGSNTVKYNTWYYGKTVKGSAFPWCMAFVQWVFTKAGMAVPVRTASCGYFVSYAKKAGQWITSGYKAGDIVIYDFDGDGSTDHCGIVESVSGSTVTAIEGNTGSGSDADGGAVMRRARKTKSIAGAFRPAYQTEVKKTVTTTEAKSILKEKAGLSDATITFLLCYKYGEDLVVKLAKAMQ